MARRKWCRDDTVILRSDVKWFMSWTTYDCPYFILGVDREWHGMVDGAVVYFFWHCPPSKLPELMCVEFDEDEGIKVLLRNLEKDKLKSLEMNKPLNIYYYGELPRELSDVLTSSNP